jgi:hypothetical protein
MMPDLQAVYKCVLGSYNYLHDEQTFFGPYNVLVLYCGAESISNTKNYGA